MADVSFADRSQARADDGISFYGVHHLALNTDDMKMTVDFYCDVLGMPLVHAMKVPPGLGTGPATAATRRSRKSATTSSTWAATACSRFSRCRRAQAAGDRDALGAMQHVSFAVSPQSQAGIRARLDAHKVPYDGPLEILPGIFSIYVFDPNDILLEFSCQPSNGEGEPCIVPQVTQTKAQALKELRSLTRDEQWLAAVTGGLRD